MDTLWSTDEWEHGLPPRRRRRHPRRTREPTAAGVARMEVEVIRSSKRRKSVSARVVDGRIVVRMPQWMTKAQEAEYVEAMVAKLVRQHTAKTVDLAARGGRAGAALRAAGAALDPVREQPGQPLGLVLTGHRRDPHQRPRGRLPRAGCSTP